MSYRYRNYRGRERPDYGSYSDRTSRKYRAARRQSHRTEQVRRQQMKRAIEQLSREERRELQKLSLGRRQQILHQAYERAESKNRLDGLHRERHYSAGERRYGKGGSRSYGRGQSRYRQRYRAEAQRKTRSAQEKRQRAGHSPAQIAASVPGINQKEQSKQIRAAGRRNQIRSFVVLKGTARKEKVPTIRSARVSSMAAGRPSRMEESSTLHRPEIYREIIPGEKRVRIRWYYYLSPEKDTSRIDDRSKQMEKVRREKTVSHLQKEKIEKTEQIERRLSHEKNIETDLVGVEHGSRKTPGSGNAGKRNRLASTDRSKRNRKSSQAKGNRTRSSASAKRKTKNFQAGLKQEISGLLKTEIKKTQQKEAQKKEYRREMTWQAMEEDERRLALSRIYGAGRLLKAFMEKLRKAANLILSKVKVLLPFASVPLMLVIIMTPLLIVLFSMMDEEETNTATGMEIVSYASEWIDVTKYVWGAGRASETDWQDYTDCSGFVHGVFAHFGYEIGGDTYSMENSGTMVASNTLEGAMPGDIVLFFSGTIASGYSSHVGIYAGNGQMIHCSGGRANTSPANAGPGVQYGSVAGDGRPYQVRRIIMDAGALGGTGTGGHRVDATSYSQTDMELIWAIVAQEDNGSYEGALAVISSAMNRCESPAWSSLGSNALSQLKAPGQYCYSNDSYWVSRLNGNVPIYVKTAVNDCLVKGVRNHRFTSFRSTKGSTTGPDAVQIGGNWFFGH